MQNNRNSNYYVGFYRAVHYKGLLGLFTNSYHQKLERKHTYRSYFRDVLEIGGGSAEHLSYVKHEFERYVLLDIEDDPQRIEIVKKDPRAAKISFLKASAEKLNFPDESFDRIIVSCVLLHIPNLELAITEMRRVARNNAVIDIYLPCDPGMLYRYSRHIISHMKQKNVMKIDMRSIKYLWATEHRGHILGAYSMCRQIFKFDKIEIKRFPFPVFSWNFNLSFFLRLTITKET